MKKSLIDFSDTAPDQCPQILSQGCIICGSQKLQMDHGSEWGDRVRKSRKNILKHYEKPNLRQLSGIDYFQIGFC